MIMVNTTTYESIKGRRWVDRSIQNQLLFVRYVLNCFKFFCGTPGQSVSDREPSLGHYGRLPVQVGEGARKGIGNVEDGMVGMLFWGFVLLF
ncbi:unnamed protein product [Choristocarpus tenellus]